jgi:hypothetical protein
MEPGRRSQCPRCRVEFTEEHFAGHVQICQADPLLVKREKKRIIVPVAGENRRVDEQSKKAEAERQRDSEMEGAIASWVEQSATWYQLDEQRRQADEKRKQFDEERRQAEELRSRAEEDQRRVERWTWYGLQAIGGQDAGLHLNVVVRWTPDQTDEHEARIWLQTGDKRWIVRNGYEERGIVTELDGQERVRITERRIGAFCAPHFVLKNIEEFDGLELARRENNFIRASD